MYKEELKPPGLHGQHMKTTRREQTIFWEPPLRISQQIILAGSLTFPLKHQYQESYKNRLKEFMEKEKSTFSWF